MLRVLLLLSMVVVVVTAAATGCFVRVSVEGEDTPQSTMYKTVEYALCDSMRFAQQRNLPESRSLVVCLTSVTYANGTVDPSQRTFAASAVQLRCAPPDTSTPKLGKCMSEYLNCTQLAQTRFGSEEITPHALIMQSDPSIHTDGDTPTYFKAFVHQPVWDLKRFYPPYPLFEVVWRHLAVEAGSLAHERVRLEKVDVYERDTVVVATAVDVSQVWMQDRGSLTLSALTSITEENSHEPKDEQHKLHNKVKSGSNKQTGEERQTGRYVEAGSSPSVRQSSPLLVAAVRNCTASGASTNLQVEGAFLKVVISKTMFTTGATLHVSTPDANVVMDHVNADALSVKGKSVLVQASTLLVVDNSTAIRAADAETARHGAVTALNDLTIKDSKVGCAGGPIFACGDEFVVAAGLQCEVHVSNTTVVGSKSELACATNKAQCEDGFFTVAPGVVMCQPCFAPKHGTTRNDTSCVPCGKGLFAKVLASGAQVCRACDADTSLLRDSGCEPCGLDKYIKQDAHMRCVDCSSGFRWQDNDPHYGCRFYSTHNMALWLMITGAVSVVTLAVVAGLCFFFRRRRQRTQKARAQSNMEGPLLQHHNM